MNLYYFAVYLHFTLALTVACPNDPDDEKLLSDVENTPIDEVFISSCLTNIGHCRAAGKLLEEFGGTLSTRMWVAPPKHELLISLPLFLTQYVTSRPFR